MAWHSLVQYNRAQLPPAAQHGSVQHNPKQHSTTCPGPAQASPAQLTREGQYGPPRPDVPAAPLRSHTTQVCWGSASPLPHPCPSESSLPGAQTGDRGVLLCPSPGTPTLPSAGPHAPPRCHPHKPVPTPPQTCHGVREHTLHSTSVAAFPRTTPHHAPIPRHAIAWGSENSTSATEGLRA